MPGADPRSLSGKKPTYFPAKEAKPSTEELDSDLALMPEPESAPESAPGPVLIPEPELAGPSAPLPVRKPAQGTRHEFYLGMPYFDDETVVKTLTLPVGE